jgi:hypothetical protein
MCDYTIVTALYNIRKRENNALKDVSNNGEFVLFDDYLQGAIPFFNKEFPLIVFCEPEDELKIWELRPVHLHEKTRVIPRSYESLPYYCHFEQFEKNHTIKPVKNLHVEKFTALYKFIIQMKTIFVKEAIAMNPFSTDMFGWMDIRLHDIYDMPNSEFEDVLKQIHPERVLITQSTYTTKEDVQNRDDFYNWTRGKICAGLFVGKKNPVLEFCRLCEAEFLQCIKDEYCPTDEMIYAFVVGNRPELFEPHVCDYCDVLRNLVYHRNSIHLASAFLHKSFQMGNHYYTNKVAESVRVGYLKNEIREISDHDMYCIWYYNYVACFWMRKYERCGELLWEYYSLLVQKENLRNHLRNFYGFFKEMISYLGNSEIIQKYDEMFL